MDKRLFVDVKRNLSAKETSELLEMWVEHDTDEYSQEAFAAARELLQERGEEVPVQKIANRRLGRQRIDLFYMLFVFIVVVSVLASLFDGGRRLYTDEQRARAGDKWLESAAWWDKPAFYAPRDEGWPRKLKHLTLADPRDVFDLIHLPERPMLILHPEHADILIREAPELTAAELTFKMYHYRELWGENTLFIWEISSEAFPNGGLVKGSFSVLLFIVVLLRILQRKKQVLPTAKGRLTLYVLAPWVSACLGTLAFVLWADKAMGLYLADLTFQRLLDAALTAFAIAIAASVWGVIHYTIRQPDDNTIR